MTENYQHINTIHLNGDDYFTTEFNACSNLYIASMDETKSEEYRKKLFEEYIQRRQCLELGIK